MKTSRAIAVACLGALVSVPVLYVPVYATSAAPLPRITVENAPHIPSGAQLRGAIAPGTPIHVSVVLNSSDPEGMSMLAGEVSDPTSPVFRHFLTPREVQERFGPAPGSLAAIRSWLSGEGLTAGDTIGDGLVVTATGSAAAVESAFGTALTQVRLPDGRVAYANTGPATVPSYLAPAIMTVIGLDDVAPPTPAGDASGEPPGAPPTTPGLTGNHGSSAVARAQSTVPPTFPRPTCSGAFGVTNAFAPYGASTSMDLANFYDITPEYAAGRFGQGVTVALYEQQGFNQSDISTFSSCYGISPSLQVVPVDGTGTGTGVGEATLDIEVVASTVPEASILVYEVSSSGNPIDGYAAIASQDRAQVVSTSWGTCEMNDSASGAENAIFEEMALQGQSVFAASGDSGAEACARSAQPVSQADQYSQPSSPDYQLWVGSPASQPVVTAVGGTEVLGVLSSATPSMQQVWNESGWNAVTGTNTNDGSGFPAPFGTGTNPPKYPGNLVSTGGISSFWVQPSWQAGFDTSGNSSGAPCGAPTGTNCREVPDVSALAGEPGYANFVSGAWNAVGGTSAASPFWASVAALAAESAPDRRLGLISPDLYAISRSDPLAFTQVTHGNNAYLSTLNSYSCTFFGVGNQPCYEATAGYNMATGLGTPVVATLVPDLDRASSGVLLASANGAVVPVGTGTSLGSMAGRALNHPIVDIAPTPDGGGYWLVASDGGVFAFGDAGFFRSGGNLSLDNPIVGIAPTPDGGGYWLVASDGGVFAYGDAGFFGSAAGAVASPVVGISPTPDGGGYRLATASGMVILQGDAVAFPRSGGSSDSATVGIVTTSDGLGYWTVDQRGSTVAYGDAASGPPDPGAGLAAPVVAAIAR